MKPRIKSKAAIVVDLPPCTILHGGRAAAHRPQAFAVGRHIGGAVLVMLVLCGMSLGQRSVRRPVRSAPVQPGGAAPESSDRAQDFDQLALQAAAAREADRVEESIGLYRRALALRPQWAEGWWYLATLLYDRDNYVDGAVAFSTCAKLQPASGATWLMLGLCEFQLTKYDEANTHIQKGRQLGLGDNIELIRVARFHDGVLRMLKGEFEKAQQILGTLSYEGVSSEDLLIALGLAVLRLGILPKQVDIKYPDRDVVRRAGLAEHFSAQRNLSDATRNYDQLAKDYPNYPGVQYAYGRFLLSNRDNDGALLAFKHELVVSPKHALARIQIGNIYLVNKSPSEGIPYIEDAIKLHPRLPLGHYVFGRLLLDANQYARAIQELELARGMVPDEPKIYFALARAYSRANRKADADKARETFARLNKQADQAAQNGEVSGSAIPEEEAGEKSTQP